MNNEMYGVKVFVSDSENIVISQTNDTGNENFVVIHPDQVDIIVKWLQEAKTEMENLCLF